jgi:hypothetical protein
MKAALRVGLSLLPLVLAVPGARAWRPETRLHMVDEAVRLMPESLRLALEAHRDALLRGTLEPMTSEDEPPHRPSWDGGSLDAEVVKAETALVEAVERPAPFREVAADFGRLAHFVADAGFPPGAAGRAGEARYAHFADFCESRRPRFPLVFYGHEDPDLERGDFRAFTLRILHQARAEDGELARAYAAAGDPPDPTAFDDRSIPFAVASLSYSRTVTNIVRAWLAAWTQAHGDLGRTPYLRSPDHDRDRRETHDDGQPHP